MKSKVEDSITGLLVVLLLVSILIIVCLLITDDKYVETIKDQQKQIEEKQTIIDSYAEGLIRNDCECAEYTEDDINRTKQIIIGDIVPTEEDTEKYDLNHSGTIDVVDLLLIKKTILGETKDCGWYEDFYYEHAEEVGAFE